MLANLLPGNPIKSGQEFPLPPCPKVAKAHFELPTYSHVTLLEDPIKWMHQHGDIFKHPRIDDSYMIANANAIERVTKTNIDNYSNNTVLFQRMKLFFGDSLLLSEGNIWKEKRKTTQKAFHAKCYERYASIMTRHVQSKVKRWEQLAQEGRCVNLHDENTLLTTKVAIHAFMNEELDDNAIKQVDNAIQYCHQHICFSMFIHPEIPTWNNWVFSRHNAFLDKMLGGFFNQREKFPEQVQDLLQILVDAKHQAGHFNYTQADVIDELKTILATGQETTACSLSWTWHLLHQNPIYHQILKEELDSVLKGEIPRVEDLPKLPYLKAIIQESMRLYPPIPMAGRVALEEDILDGYRIPKNSQVVINLHATHRNPKYWDNPNTFDPERFIDFRVNKQTRFNYLPFLPGRRTCLAGHFAMLEMQLALGALAARFKLAMKSNKPIHPLPMISLRPNRKIPVVIEKYR